MSLGGVPPSAALCSAVDLTVPAGRMAAARFSPATR
jgi:hypothetical protein